MKKVSNKKIPLKHQQGSVLLWGLVGLLVLAALGITASRISTLDNRIVGNAMFDDFTYQGAESSLRRSVNLFNIEQTAKHEASTNEDKELGPFTDEVGTGEQINSSSMVSMGAIMPCPPVLPGIAMSTAMTAKSGGVACRLFTVNADSNVPGTSAKSQHVAGILKFVPAQ